MMTIAYSTTISVTIITITVIIAVMIAVSLIVSISNAIILFIPEGQPGLATSAMRPVLVISIRKIPD